VRRYRADYKKAAKRGTATPVIVQAAQLHEACREALRRYHDESDPDRAAALLRILAQLEAKLLALYPTMGLIRDSVQRRNAAAAGDDAEARRRFQQTFGGSDEDEE